MALPARYRLQLSNQVKNPAYTSYPVHAIHIAIYDTHTRSYISSECFHSSAKIRLAVLSDELWVNKGENWSRSDFNESVLRAREGKGPILKDLSLKIRLVNGLITFENIIFNDNSSWTRSGFRLGVVVEGEGEEGYLNGARVREGVSKAFRVLDRHQKKYQKPDLLTLTDKVQSLKEVGKDRASLLQRNNIKTVEDFLCWYNNNELELRKILGIKSECHKGWKSMIEHAMQCANEFYAKYNTLKSSMSNSGYVGPLSPRKMMNIKIVLKFIITVLAGPRSHARIVPPAIYNTTENTSQPQQDLYGPLVVGSSSLEPNSFENNIIEGDILRQLDADWASLIEHIPTDSGENIVEAQPAFSHETNVSPLEGLDWIEDQYGNESEHTAIARGNIVNANSMQSITGNDILEDLQPNTESTSPSRSDSLDGFIASILNSEPYSSLNVVNEYTSTDNILQNPSRSVLVNSEGVEPLTPCRKRKMMALVRPITFLAILRKRARIVPPASQIVPPASQMTVPAI